jgi:hypothetical protein
MGAHSCNPSYSAEGRRILSSRLPWAKLRRRYYVKNKNNNSNNRKIKTKRLSVAAHIPTSLGPWVQYGNK